MKTIFFMLSSLSATFTAFAQCQPGEIYECAVAFTYDNAGNRVERKQVCACVIPSPQGRAANSNKEPIEQNTLVTTETRTATAQIVSIAPKVFVYSFPHQ
jgi:hypothetical protein